MSATRLLVLGVVRFMQPVHGYDVRRELLSWRLEESTHIKPGSIYSALKTLEKDGLLTAQDRAADGKPERTPYVITAEGEKEFQTLLRAAWWRVIGPMEPLVPALCLMPALPREEVVAAVQARQAQLRSTLEELRFLRAGIRDGATGEDGDIPEHVREIADFHAARVRSELEWGKTFLGRVRAGAYTFVGDSDNQD
jgi:DNA-binding PadR family transcriptional regulator